MVPSGWSVKTLKQLVSKERKITYGIVVPGPPDQSGNYMIRAQDYSKGWNDLSKIYRVSMEVDESYKRSRVKAGDIILTIVGAGVGNISKIPTTLDGANLTQQTARLSFENHVPDYFMYVMKSDIGRKEVYKYTKTGAQPSLNLSDIELMLVPTPPLPEQQKIAKILSIWGKAISTTERLIDNSNQQKKALMQHLLTGKKRLLDDSGKPFEGEWKKVELGKLLDYKQPTPYLVKSTAYSDEYSTPVLTAGKTFVLGYSNEDFGIFKEELPAIIFDDFTTATKFVDFPFKAKSSAMKILVAKEGVSIKYIYEAMQVLNYPIGGHQRHWISIFSNIVIGLPTPEEQQKIAAVLTNADKEIELLGQQLTDLKQEKKALMQQLLTGKRRVKVGKEAM